ncbi:hypothetical protein KHQ81_12955 [Mycoplasmatota bacterium]|nr:hypothetical protein KHQ81_12955 [Mycoplasmatota bacterium]
MQFSGATWQGVLAVTITDDEIDIFKKRVTKKGILRSRKYKDVLEYLVSISKEKDFEKLIANIEDPLFKSDVAYVLEKIIDNLTDTARNFRFSYELKDLIKKTDTFKRINVRDEVLF